MATNPLYQGAGAAGDNPLYQPAGSVANNPLYQPAGEFDNPLDDSHVNSNPLYEGHP
ncbi:MAG TPA: hypothetical protein VLK84_27930 [Longimicrobium sp.]|nr:hypothetical protein [Longimicrobium sp.]